MAMYTQKEVQGSSYGPETPGQQGLGNDNTMGTITALGSGAISGATTGSSVAPGWGTAVGAVVGALLSWYGMEKQSQAANAANVQNTDIYNQEKATEEKRYQAGLKMTKENNAFQRAQTAREWKWKEEGRNWEIISGLSDRLLNIMNSQPSFQNLLTQRWQKPQQQAYNFRGLNPIGA